MKRRTLLKGLAAVPLLTIPALGFPAVREAVMFQQGFRVKTFHEFLDSVPRLVKAFESSLSMYEVHIWRCLPELNLVLDFDTKLVDVTMTARAVVTKKSYDNWDERPWKPHDRVYWQVPRVNSKHWATSIRPLPPKKIALYSGKVVDQDYYDALPQNIGLA